MNVCAIIPARGGSRRLPQKNIASCAGKPLLYWSIQAANASSTVSRIIVSTDDQQIADTARVYGAEVHDRPAIHAGDTSSLDVALTGCVRTLTPVPDLVVTLQPTCPVRAEGLIDATVKRLLDTDADTAFTAYREPLCFLFVDRASATWAEYADWQPIGGSWVQEQQMGPRDFGWRFDGSVVVTRTDMLLQTGRRVCGRIGIQPNVRTVDVDTAADLARADAMLRAGEAVPA